MIEAILFDFDGVLRDSRDVIWPAVERTLEAYGIEYEDRERLMPYVHHIGSVHKNIAPHVDKNMFTDTYIKKADELRYRQMLYEGAPELLESLHGQGYKIGLASSATTFLGLLEEHDLVKYFDVLVGGKDTVEHKPHPEPVIKALGAIGIKPNNAIMVGDLEADITAANLAGVERTVGVTHGFGTREMLEQAGATYIIDKLSQLPAVLGEINGS